MIEQVLGWLANFCVVMGAVYLARKNVLGFGWHILGCVFYGTQGLLMSNWSLVSLDAFLIIMNIWTWRVWYDAFKDKE